VQGVQEYIKVEPAKCSVLRQRTGALQGACIGEGCHIDTLDVCDFELVTLGDNVVLNEGSSITGHYFQDGMLHFKEVSSCSLCPCFHTAAAHCSSIGSQDPVSTILERALPCSTPCHRT
jgi:hypothetical protein